MIPLGVLAGRLRAADGVLEATLTDTLTVRQQIRDTRLQTGTLDSADVGPDAT